MSFPRYEAYRDSQSGWLSKVPVHWDLRSLRYCLTDVFNGLVATQIDEADDSLPVTRIETISSGTIDESRLGFIARTDAREHHKLRRGDVLFSNINSMNMIGNCAIYSGGREIYAGMNLLVLRPASDCYPKWFYWLIRSSIFRQVVESLAKPAINQASVSQSSLKGIEVPTPSQPEQHAISSFLDRETAKIDALVAEQRRLVELLKEKRQAVISHAVTKGLDPAVPMKPSGIEWLGDIPEHWEVQRIKYAIRSIEQGWSPQCENEPVQSQEQWGVLKVGCVNHGKFTPEENKALPDTLEPQPELTIQRGDLLISRANTIELVGSAAVAEQNHPNLMLCDKLYRLRFDRDLMSPEFFCYFLACEPAREQIELGASGASPSMKNIAQSVILEMWVACPGIGEQWEIIQAIRERCVQIISLITEAERAVLLLQERRTALISAAVTGKIDVRDFASTGVQT